MEQFDVDVRLRMRADLLPLDADRLAEIIAQAVNSHMPVVDFVQCDAVEVEGDICWQHDDPSTHELH